MTPHSPLLPLRAALVLLLSLVVGLIAGFLSYLADGSVPTAALIGGGAAGGALALFDRIVGRRP
mgnify:CR=1 FL=1